MMHPDRNVRLIELLVDNATVGLAPSEWSELEQYGSEGRSPSEADMFELAAAAADLAFYEKAQVGMPRALRDRLLVSAGRELDQLPGNQGHSSAVPASNSVERRRIPTTAPRWREVASFLVAAACVVILLVNLDGIMEPVPNRAGSGVAQVLPVSAQQEYQRLGAELGQSYSRPTWYRGPNDADETGLGATGDLVWDQSAQRGVMRFTGLPVNDPLQEQYQLWIFESGDQAHPIDGGVFNITKSDEYIPINAKLHVGDEPVLFAVTIEKPGGVVVSDRSRLPLWTAAPASLP